MASTGVWRRDEARQGASVRRHVRPSRRVVRHSDPSITSPIPKIESVDATANPTSPATRVGTTLALDRSDWRRRYIGVLLMSDLLSGVLASNTTMALSESGGSEPQGNVVTALLLPIAWVALLAFNRAYEGRSIGVGSQEIRHVSRAFLYLFASIAIASYITRIDVAREFVLLAVPMAFLFALIGRYVARKWLHGQRSHGVALTTVLLLGDGRSIVEFTQLLDRDIHAGMKVIGACLPADQLVDTTTVQMIEACDVPVLGDVDSLGAAIQASAADTVAVVSASALGPQKLRWISWQLEGLTTDLVVVPGLVEVAGTRLHIRPVSGLPLLHVDEPRFTGPARVLKATFDRVVSAAALVLAAPILLLIALAVRLDSKGPVLFRQTRVGLNGETFTMHKFRSMRVEAEALLADVMNLNDHHDGHVLFKVREDPRVTRTGKWLRRLSIDELPQLIDVARGKMSLVGPRPPLPAEVARYEEHVHRRLLVKPGLTGLWQISGRSNLAWEESVRLDLRYVENWSLTGDLLILWKTLFAVLRREGAY